MSREEKQQTKEAKKAARLAQREAEKAAYEKEKKAKAKRKQANKEELQRIQKLTGEEKKEALKAFKEKKRIERDSWFTWRGIRKEAKRVQWPGWKSTTEKGVGIARNSTEVIAFTGFFAIYFALINWGVAYLLRFIGIGG